MHQCLIHNYTNIQTKESHLTMTMKTTREIIGNYRAVALLGVQAHGALKRLKDQSLTIADLIENDKDLDATEIGNFQVVLGCISIQILSIETALALNDLQAPAMKDIFENARLLVTEIDHTLTSQSSSIH